MATEYFIKLVYSKIDQKQKQEHTSLLAYSRYAVNYALDQWIYPVKGTKLFVFQKLAYAYVFMNRNGRSWKMPTALPFLGITAWWCEVINPVFPLVAPYHAPNDELIEAYWKRYPHPQTDVFVPWFNKPAGSSLFGSSVFADAVKLVHPVTEEDIFALVPYDTIT